jgi:YD repeat-containing protein
MVVNATTLINDKDITSITTKNALGQLETLTNAVGNLLNSTDASGRNNALLYDINDRKIQMNDPDVGIWTYKYNSFGELEYQKNAKGQVVLLEYDTLGHQVKRTEEGVSEWIYDEAEYGVGKLAGVLAPDGYQKTFTYDDKGRAAETTVDTQDESYRVKTEYDAFGRVSKVTQPGKNHYQNQQTQYQNIAQGYVDYTSRYDDQGAWIELLQWQQDLHSDIASDINNIMMMTVRQKN